MIKKYFRIVLFVWGIILILSSSENLFSQTIQYEYQANGSRILRHPILLKSTSNGKDSSDFNVQDNEDKISTNLGQRDIKIFPNPTRGILFININLVNQDEKVNYTLYSQVGTILETRRGLSSNFEITMDSLPPGQYILILGINNEESQWTIIKQ